MKSCPVHLHVLDARHLGVEEDILLDIEKGGFGRLLNADDRRRRMAFRCRIRRILSEQTGATPENIQFETNAHGKPSLPGGPHFNLSHAGDLAVLAICRDAPVGVDIEPRARGSEITGCLQSIAHPSEAEGMRGLGPEAFARTLIRLWVAKEAALKAMGTGLSIEPSEFAIIREDACHGTVRWGRGQGGSSVRIHTINLRLDELPGMEVAVALTGARPTVNIGEPAMKALAPA